MFKVVAKKLGDDINLALVALHALTGCDTTSAFVPTLLNQHPQFHQVSCSRIKS